MKSRILSSTYYYELLVQPNSRVTALLGYHTVVFIKRMLYVKRHLRIELDPQNRITQGLEIWHACFTFQPAKNVVIYHH